MEDSEEKNQSCINLLQINLGHRLWAHEALMAWLHSEDAQKVWILCIQEPYFSKKGISKLPRNYGAFWNDMDQFEQTNKKPRAAIFMPKSLGGYMVTQHSSLDVVTVRIGKIDLSVISGYCSIDTDIEKSLEYVMKEVGSKRKVLCYLDSNAYHARWGSNLKRNIGWRGRKRGEKLIDLIDDNNLLICNQTPHRATFTRDSTTKDESHIDITICSYNIFNQIESWRVREETFMSDHRVISCKYMCNVQRHSSQTEKQEQAIPWKKPCLKMKVIMEKALTEAVWGTKKLATTGDVDVFIDVHATNIKQVLNKVFKKKERRDENVFWWTEEVALEYVKLRLARRRMRRYGHKNLREEFVKCRVSFRQVVQRVKLDAWKNFTSEIRDPWNKLIKIVKATTTGKILSRTLHDLSGIYAENMNDTLMLLGRQFYPQPEEKSVFHLNVEYEVMRRLKVYQAGSDITSHELRSAVQQLSKATAPGFDGITNNIIQCLVKKTSMQATYLKMFNICLRNSYFPQEWKKAKVVLIPKPSTDSNSVKSFRPISLTSSFAKLFERIILARAQHYLTLSDKIVENQHAYQKGRSTLTALYDVFDVVQYALHKRGGEKSVCVIVFLDISGAFDRTWHYGILYKLLDYDVPEYLVAWIKDFLDERKAYFMDSDVTYEVDLAQGYPQGGVLSPTLWNVLFNEMLALPTYTGKKKNDRLKVVGYADDAAIVCKAASVEDASSLLNTHLQKISDWLKRYRIKFNPAKLAVLTISNRVQKPSPASVYYDGTLINEVSQYKYLGLIVDNKCTWKPHMDSVIHKLSLVTRSLRGLSRSNWGISLQVYRMLFHAIFVPVMTYGIVIWGWKATHKNVCARFDKQIRDFAILATRCLKSTSTTYLFGLLNTSDFANILQFKVLKTSVLQFHIVHSKRQGVYDNYRSKRITKEVPQSIDHHYTHV